MTNRLNDTLDQTFSTDGANQLTGVGSINTMTVVGNLNNTVSGLTIDDQPADIYGDNTYAAEGINLNDGLNTFTNVITVSGSTYTNYLARNLPTNSTILYDANGNTISDGWKGSTYDCANELTSITVTNEWRNTYLYDGLGRRRITKNYLWSGEMNSTSQP